MDYLFILSLPQFSRLSSACPHCSVIPALLFSSTMRKRRDSTKTQKKKEMIFLSMFKNNHGSEQGDVKEKKPRRRREKNSHKIFIVMLATLLPCLFSTMHEYTPLSVRLSPLGNSKAGVVISTSLVSKRFQ